MHIENIYWRKIDRTRTVSELRLKQGALSLSEFCRCTGFSDSSVERQAHLHIISRKRRKGNSTNNRRHQLEVWSSQSKICLIKTLVARP